MRQDVHAVWGARLRRGRVPQGEEAQVARQAICAALKRFGVKYPPREVGVLVRGDRVESFFIYEKGHPGVLSLHRGGEQWRAEPKG